MALKPFSNIFNDFTKINRTNDVFFGSLIFPTLSFNKNMKIDMKENNKEYVLKVDLPGIDKDKINISIDNNLLTIRSERINDNSYNEYEYHFSERFYGKINRTLSIPQNVDLENIYANYVDGVLIISLQKINNSNIKNIKVN